MRSIFTTVLIVCVSFAGIAFGQSISIVKQGTTNFTVVASAPSDNPHTLQASENLTLWFDIQEVTASVDYQVDASKRARRYFRLVPAGPPAPPIRVMLLGDSMTSDCCGWGGGIYSYFKENVTVINYAAAWTSSKVFLGSVEKDNMLLVKPDYVLIQYGYMDQAWGADLAPETYTSEEEFAENLRTIIDMVRGFSGIPILVTTHSARVWDSEGKVIPTWTERNAVTKRVASETGAHLIDLNQLTMDLFNELGPSCNEWMHLPGFADDDVMHMSVLGGKFVARLVVMAMPSSVAPYLTGISEPPPIPE